MAKHDLIQVEERTLILVLEALEAAMNEVRGEPDTEWTKLDYQLADSVADVKNILGEDDA